MQTDTRIDRFETVYHVAEDFDEFERLDDVRKLLLDSHLEPAIERAVLPDDCEICVKELHLTVNLPLSSTGTVLASAWAEQMRTALERSIRDGDPGNVVVYRSVVHALADLLISTAREQFERHWAWRQLGLAPFAATSGFETAATAVLETFRRDPPAIRSTLHLCVDAGSFPLVASRYPERWWRAVIDELHGLGGQPDATRQIHVDEVANARNGDRPDDDIGCKDEARVPERITDDSRVEVAGRLAARSVLWCAIGELARVCVIAPEKQALLAELAMIDVAPGRRYAHAGARARRVGFFREMLFEWAARSRVPATLHPAGRFAGGPEHSGARAPSDGPMSRDTTSGMGDARPRPGLAAPAPAAESSKPRSASRTGSASETLARTEGALFGWTPRERAYTSNGGVLYLINLLRDDDPIVCAAALGEAGDRRSIGWWLHRLALELTNAAAADPACLAFCGMMPSDRPPSTLEREPDRDECRLIAKTDGSIRTRLLTAGLLQARADAPGLRRLLRRNAEIVADRGWLEIVYSLQDVDTNVRRAGLDLDPMYVQWLGVSVKFRYR